MCATETCFARRIHPLARLANHACVRGKHVCAPFASLGLFCSTHSILSVPSPTPFLIVRPHSSTTWSWQCGPLQLREHAPLVAVAFHAEVLCALARCASGCLLSSFLSAFGLHMCHYGHCSSTVFCKTSDVSVLPMVNTLSAPGRVCPLS